MAFNYRTGPNNVAEYQASGLPYVTQSVATAGSVSNVQFPFVTNEITVKNNSDGVLKIAFTANGLAGSNFFTLPVSGSYGGRLRVTDIYLSAQAGSVTYEVVAGLTTIPRRDYYLLTGALNVFSGSDAQILQYENRGLGYNGLG